MLFGDSKKYSTASGGLSPELVFTIKTFRTESSYVWKVETIPQ